MTLPLRLGSLRNRIAIELDRFTEHWIGWTFPPAERALAEADWTPDQCERYCPRCGDSIGAGEATPGGCGTCRKGGELAGGLGDGVVRLGPYVNPLRDWVLKLKYERWAEIGRELGAMLARQVRAADVLDLERTLIVPTPMPWQRRVYRGIDHVRLIAAAAGHELHVPVADVLARRHRPPQVTLPPAERKRTGGRGLAIRRRLGGWPLQGLHILLVDDVRTTGATLKGATRLLRRLKPERIVIGVLAVSDSAARRARDRLPIASAAAPDALLDRVVQVVGTVTKSE